ncbi:MAG TPA: glycoside hydrolase 43 family protein [Lacunisphaera sp.]|nr:glycoside hydrolase 43 family protein [Lacunisphaera sp.]
MIIRLGLLLLTLVAARAGQSEAPLPWGDQGDGTYRNPILPADFSDPDVIRVGDDFYLVASEFHFLGMQVLHSRDLVNWQIIGQVFDRLGFDPKYSENRAYSQGTWAPTLRYHGGTFHLYVCTPRDGLLHYTAKNAAGPWTGGLMKTVDQWEDPCPFWDDDGSAWLVHGKLGAGPLILHQMSPDGSQLLDDGVQIYHGPVAEGPKIYKRHGWYYISLPEGGVERGGQTVLRSRTIRGPYERRVVMPDGSPHQGGLVELDSGEAWFIGFKSVGALGRVPILQPVKWVDDWPVFGDGGKPVVEGRKPKVEGRHPIGHPQTSDEFEGGQLGLQWQWNHNPVDSAWSLSERAGWLRLHGQPAANLELARNSLTQKLWGQGGAFEVKLEGATLTDGQRAGLAFMSGKFFSAVGLERSGGTLRFYSEDYEPNPPGSPPTMPPPLSKATAGPNVAGLAEAGGSTKAPGSATPATVWLRGEYLGETARLAYSTDGKTFTDTGLEVKLRFSQWKGARLALYCYGPGGGAADFDFLRFTHGREAMPVKLTAATPIDREALVRRHNVVIRKVDPTAPLTVGNGGFAFTVDATGLQTFGEYYYQHGIPLETMARWCWATDENPNGYKLADASRDYVQPDGTTVNLPSVLGTPASDWLRRNPRLHPLGQISLEWADGTMLKPEDLTDIEQTLDLWTGIITSKYKLRGVPVTVTTGCDSGTDTVALRLESKLIDQDKIRVRLAFPRGHDPAVKNTPALDWSHPESHQSILRGDDQVDRSIPGASYSVMTNQRLNAIAPHRFEILPRKQSGVLEVSLRFDRAKTTPEPREVLSRSAVHWPQFWRSGAAVDFTGSTSPLAAKMEERIILSRYLTAVQCVGEVPPQESGLTCNTWYGKHHTEMIVWHDAHFFLWGQTAMAKTNLDWFLDKLPVARATAAARGLKGARWSKMIGPDGRESPGGNPLIVWNQPHLIYLCDLALRQSPSAENLEKYKQLVFDTAECLVSMLKFDAKRGQYVLGPPLWIAQEIHDPATSQNPGYELAYWRWAIETAQRWRVRSGLPREAHWDEVLARLSPLPVFEGKYTALESHPDTWTNLDSRHDHPEMLMAMGFFPPGKDVDRATMDRTLTAVLKEWDWKTKIFGWDYPMVAMAAARLNRPEDAVEILLRDGPNNIYFPNGHCPVGSDRAQGNQLEGRREIAVYLPANGSFLSAVALMVAGWEGSEEMPGIPKDGTWKVRAEGLMRLP